VKEEMKRGRSQVIWRYAPGAMFRYNETGGWCTTTTVTMQKAGPLQGALAKALVQGLRRWNAVGQNGFPDPLSQAGKYVVGEPFQVMYSLWPTVFTCRECGRVQFYQLLSNLQHTNERLRCRDCNGRDQLRQVPYAYVCECGRLDSVYIPSNVPGLPTHNRDHFIELVNRGSFQDSFWRCRDCRRPLYRNPREGLGFRRCECSPKKGKRGVLLEDSRVHYSQTLDLVDIEPKALDRWKEHPRFSDVLLAAILRVPAYNRHHLLDLAAWKPTEVGRLSPELQHMKATLIKDLGLTDEQADTMVRKSAQQGGLNPWTAYDSDLTAFRSTVGAVSWQESRRTVEFVFVRDEPSAAAISLDDLINETATNGDQASSDRLREEQKLASKLGLTDLRIVQALPILLAGMGYTRYFGNPQDKDGTVGSNVGQVILRTYPTIDGKIPVYVARNTTEALLYELDPWRLAAFLEANSAADISSDATRSESSIRAWLLAQSSRLVQFGESHYLLKPFEIEAGLTVEDASALLFGILHTFSHVLKATAHRYVGIDADSQAEYLFPAHGAGLLYISSHVEFTLGGMDSVFRSNLTQWLASARDYAGRCSFDPVCRQSGGACSACLYPKFGCGYFNRTVSRSFLLGGEIPGRAHPVTGFWDRQVAERAQQLAARRSIPTSS
jgi:hypothetical protein